MHAKNPIQNERPSGHVATEQQRRHWNAHPTLPPPGCLVARVRTPHVALP
jgi:hypothetical protein